MPDKPQDPHTKKATPREKGAPTKDILRAIDDGLVFAGACRQRYRTTDALHPDYVRPEDVKRRLVDEACHGGDAHLTKLQRNYEKKQRAATDAHATLRAAIESFERDKQRTIKTRTDRIRKEHEALRAWHSELQGEVATRWTAEDHAHVRERVAAFLKACTDARRLARYDES